MIARKPALWTSNTFVIGFCLSTVEFDWHTACRFERGRQRGERLRPQRPEFREIQATPRVQNRRMPRNAKPNHESVVGHSWPLVSTNGTAKSLSWTRIGQRNANNREGNNEEYGTAVPGFINTTAWSYLWNEVLNVWPSSPGRPRGFCVRAR